MKLKYNFLSQTIIGILLKNGVAKEDIYSLKGLVINEDYPLESEINIEFIHHLILFFKKRMNTQHCGLDIIMHFDFQNADFFGPYAFSCPTLGEAVKKIYSVSKQLNPIISYEMTPSDKPSHFVYILDRMWEVNYPESAREIIEFIIAIGLISSRALTNKDIVPLQLSLKYEEPADISRYREIFRCPVHFSREENSISYPPGIMDYNVPTYNPTLLKILSDFARKIIRENELNKDIVSEVKALIVKAEDYKIPKEDEIAGELNISKRTLQKKLQEKNTTFLRILDDIQKNLALAYLDSKSISNKEIAWVLGYNDLSNFYRAFRRWTGMTPVEYREKA